MCADHGDSGDDRGLEGFHVKANASVVVVLKCDNGFSDNLGLWNFVADDRFVFLSH